MIAATQVRVIVVTPETTLLDESARMLRFPLYDGQIGVLPGRAPMVGRLGVGELRIEGADGTQRLFLDGGFVQIKGGVVTLLTSRAMRADEIDVKAAEEELDAAQKLAPTTDAGFAEKQQAIERARSLLAMRRRG